MIWSVSIFAAPTVRAGAAGRHSRLRDGLRQPSVFGQFRELTKGFLSFYLCFVGGELGSFFVGVEDFASEVGVAAGRPPEDEWGGNEDRGVGSDEDSDDKGKGEVAERWATEDVEGDDHDERRQRGEQRSGER